MSLSGLKPGIYSTQPSELRYARSTAKLLKKEQFINNAFCWQQFLDEVNSRMTRAKCRQCLQQEVKSDRNKNLPLCLKWQPDHLSLFSHTEIYRNIPYRFQDRNRPPHFQRYVHFFLCIFQSNKRRYDAFLQNSNVILSARWLRGAHHVIGEIRNRNG
jgi:hypothetical protein